jgi:hypothetical protein
MTKRFLLRINQELWVELNRWATDELRSVNGQIEYILRQAVARRKHDWRPREESPQKPEPRGGRTISEP